MKKSFLGIAGLVLWALMLLVGCKDKGAIPRDDKGREDFEVFYKRFNSDSAFQVERTYFPLPGKDSDGKPKVWPEETWRFLKLDDVEKDDRMKVIVEDMGNAVRERIIVDKIFVIERQYSLEANKNWYLIYYADIQLLEQAGNGSGSRVDTIPSDHPDVDSLGNN